MTEYDVFINAAGSSPDSSFLMNTCLKTDSGFINCDENFQTADSNIYAIGDVSVSNNLNNQHWAYAQVTFWRTIPFQQLKVMRCYEALSYIILIGKWQSGSPSYFGKTI